MPRYYVSIWEKTVLIYNKDVLSKCCCCARVFQSVGGRDPSLPKSKRDSSYILLISAVPLAPTLLEVHNSGGIPEKLGK